MKTIKKIFNHIFIDGLSGMALGLFATLIIGTIIEQIGTLIGGTVGGCIAAVAAVAKSVTGAGIGVGVACKFKASPLVTVSAAGAGMVGAFASKIIAGSLIDAGVTYIGPGEPLGAFVAALVAIELGMLISGKTKLDIILTPAVSILSGSAVGLLLGPPISSFMAMLGNIINWGTENQPVIMGIVVAAVMGVVLTLPISSAALGIILGLTGIAGGAAVVGCSAHMIGFAVMSYRENKFGGLIAQGLGTSMLQMPNLVKKPVLWIPPIVASAVLGPISTKLLAMECLPSGAGMGTSGLVGQIMTYNAMTASGFSRTQIFIEIAIMHFIAPAIITLVISEGMRKLKIIKPGDLELKGIN